MHADRAASEKATMTEPRSWLFVPADSERKIAKALDSDADAIIFDLEDSVAPAKKPLARDILRRPAEALQRPGMVASHQSARKRISQGGPQADRRRLLHGIVLPKAESGADVTELAHRTGNIPVHAIVTETAASLFGLLSYRDPKSPLAAMSWGAEDLSAALGASSKYDSGGELSFTYQSPARSASPAPLQRGSSRSTASSPTSRMTRASEPRRRRPAATASPAS